jgi:hypothetical protein
MFETVRNLGLAMKKMIISAMSVPKASICWSPWPSEANRPVRSAAAALVPGDDWVWASARSSVRGVVMPLLPRCSEWPVS